MARVYPSAGSAYTYVGQEMHSSLGYIVGWGMVMDYLLNPLICTAFCAKAAMNILPGLSYYVWILIFAAFFTWMNLRGIKTSAQFNEALCAGMVVVVLIFLASVIRALWGVHHQSGFFTNPFYQPGNFHPAITGLLSGLEVYAAQLIWGSKPFPSDQIESAFALLSRQAGGVLLFQIINVTLLLANMGSALGSQLAAGRLLYGMGRGNALPRAFFGAIEPKRRIHRNNIIAVGAFALAGAGILEFFAGRLGGGAYEIGAEALNFGAFIAFMGVNAASFLHHRRHAKSGNQSGLIVPALGFLICGFIWLHLSRPALLLGTIWMAAGIAYGAFRTKGFRSELVSFEIPPDEA
jgi:putrescine importer